MNECNHKWDEKTCMFCKLESERDAARAKVEAAVRATIEACAMELERKYTIGLREVHQTVRRMDPAPIVARVLGGGE